MLGPLVLQDKVEPLALLEPWVHQVKQVLLVNLE